MNNSFNDLGISPPLLKAIAEMGFETPTEVQIRAIPPVLRREDVIVMSKTGSGKTAVFGVPMLQMIDPAAEGPQGLILTPTRELAVQVDSDIRRMAKHLPHRTTAVYGQHDINAEIRDLTKGVSAVTGTPGRVYDHISRRSLETKHIRFFVLDEADRMLDMGFIDQVVRIIRTLPKDRVTLVFSATIPAEVRRICRDYMKRPTTIEIESPTMTVDTIEQVYYRVERNEKLTQLNRLLLFEQPESCLIFCNTRIAVDRVQGYLFRKGYACHALHGEIPQGKRLRTMQQFKRGEFNLLVATDVAARGIHIEGLSLVINYDVPEEKDSYVHRIGRTGRAGECGRAISLVTGDDIISLYEIEEHIGAMIEQAELPSDAALKERRAGTEKWVKAQVPPAKPPQAAEAKAKNRRRRSSGRRPPRQSAPQGSRPGGADRGREASRKTPAPPPAEKTASSSGAVKKTAVPPAETGKPFRSSTKPAPFPAPAAAAGAKETAAAEQRLEAAKKPFLQRLVQRILRK